jgi:N-acetylglucosaminyldiphosphoundecaprenol N-acetyl-beta-D-mannosaminyltransferase
MSRIAATNTVPNSVAGVREVKAAGRTRRLTSYARIRPSATERGGDSVAINPLLMCVPALEREPAQLDWSVPGASHDAALPAAGLAGAFDIGEQSASVPQRRIEMMGCQIDNLSMAETLLTIEGFIKSGKPHQHVVVNVDKLVKASKDADLRQIINDCALINADGMPVVWASRLLGKPLKERVTGVDLFEALMRRSAEKGWRVYLLGAREEVVSEVKLRYEEKYRGITIAGYRNGYWKPEEEAGVVEAIKAARADVLFVAISSPKKEQFLGRCQADMKVPFTMGVGGTFDVVVGKVKRAPVWMQRFGMEWFYRFLQEPRRLFKRYFIDDVAFLKLLAIEMFKR